MFQLRFLTVTYRLKYVDEVLASLLTVDSMPGFKLNVLILPLRDNKK